MLVKLIKKITFVDMTHGYKKWIYDVAQDISELEFAELKRDYPTMFQAIEKPSEPLKELPKKDDKMLRVYRNK